MSLRILMVALAMTTASVCAKQIGTRPSWLRGTGARHHERAAGSKETANLSVPLGTNFGGWLVLEDWFFSGSAGKFVSSPDGVEQGFCLPPLLERVEKAWSSEGSLTKHLNDTRGAEGAIAVFRAHRDAFITEADFEQIAAAGIRHLRVPLPWAAFADALAPLDEATYGGHDAERQAVVVPDPFHFEEAAFVTVPRNRLLELLRLANEHGLKVLLELHTMPGGSSQGTYNGVWPAKPAFWAQKARLGHGNVQLQEAGLWIAKALVSFVEKLQKPLRDSVLGLSMMNEPAHMAGPSSLAGDPFADEQDVLNWLEKTANIFRASKLPARGTRLYVNLIDSAFTDARNTMPNWWNRTFTRKERFTWAVIDLHWYAAWSAGSCDGRSTAGGGYTCDQPADEIRGLLRHCVRPWAALFAKGFEGLRACSEFSVGTYQYGSEACQDPSVLRIFLEEQMEAFDNHTIEPFFWTWRMPYGPVFESGWSLKKLLGHERPNASATCSALTAL